MIKRTSWQLVFVMVAGLIALLSLGLVVAQTASAARSFSPEPVPAGTELTVTITGTGYGGPREIGQVMETLPDAEFTYVEGSATRVSGHPNGVVRGKVDPDNDRMVTFTVVSVASFTYRVMVGSGVPGGQYPFSGDAGDSSVTVGPSDTTPPTPTPTPPSPEPGSATRSFSPEPVPAGTELTVTITGTGHGEQGEIGRVMETLPAGFSYEEGSATRVSGDPNGVVRGKVDPDNDRMVTFTVMSVASFTYRVMVGSGVPDGQYPFSGDAGDSSVTVGGSAPSPGGATRSFSPEPVPAGTELTVTITGTGYGGPREIGRVMETLPDAEFTYVEGSATRVSGHPNGVVRGKVDPDNDRMVTFTVVSVASFTYRVMVGSGMPDGQYPFSGDAGDSSVTVGGSAPSPGGATRSFSPEPVPAGTVLTVTITGTGYGGPREIGQVMETLPDAEFTYVEGSATRVSGDPNGVVRGKVDPGQRQNSHFHGGVGSVLHVQGYGRLRRAGWSVSFLR